MSLSFGRSPTAEALELWKSLDKVRMLPENHSCKRNKNWINIQAWIAQLVEQLLGTREVRGSNPDKGENFSVIRNSNLCAVK